MNYETRKFLRLCRQVGYEQISIGLYPQQGFKGPWRFTSNYAVRGYPDIHLGHKIRYPDGTIKRQDLWPAIWHCLSLVPEANFGCGSSQTHQCKRVLEEGLYDLTAIKF